jgi:hypothetical protein
MKPTFAIIILLLASAFTFPEEDSEARKEIREANRTYFKEVAKARSDFRVQLARSMRHADRIEIYLLDFEIDPRRRNPLFDAFGFQEDECFSWRCQNFAVTYPDRKTWVQIHGDELHKAFEALLPVPQAETDRFNETLGPQKAPSSP